MKSISIRIPDNLHLLLTTIAKINFRSLNDQMLYLIHLAAEIELTKRKEDDPVRARILELLDETTY